MDRAQVLAYRVAAHQLDRSVADAADLAVLDLGVQDTPNGAVTVTPFGKLPANVRRAVQAEAAALAALREVPEARVRFEE